jgi:hypothetical protein
MSKSNRGWKKLPLSIGKSFGNCLRSGGMLLYVALFFRTLAEVFNRVLDCASKAEIRWMEEILHQLTGGLSH